MAFAFGDLRLSRSCPLFRRLPFAPSCRPFDRLGRSGKFGPRDVDTPFATFIPAFSGTTVRAVVPVARSVRTLWSMRAMRPPIAVRRAGNETARRRLTSA
ncbi:hypothetical protein WS71_11350 [Burkholderia mayonis]|uniref:Uncharacterized protein n=1 Tax=Burkholderia mayonis TaxID=1385591 RepID=A0A1B4FVX0_9BURK|nr:hypothetical protein WS71_11350 [Burkholderia mayonis]KVE50210.1 hypothetical protein WS71_14085 [Burkholderia mayonis]